MKIRISQLLLLLFLLPLPLHTQAKTYIFTDGSRSLSYTAETAAPEDQEALYRPLELTLCWRGQESRLSSPGETVGQLLDRLGLTVTAADSLSHDLSEQVTDGMRLTVTHTLIRQETYTAVIPHETTRCLDHSLSEGQEEVLVEGRDGELLCTASVTYVNGQEVCREIRQSRQTLAPVTAVIAAGTAPAEPEPEQQMPVIEDGYIRMPSGELLTYYKTDNVTATGYTHTDVGCDLITSTGTTVRYGTAAVDPRFIPYGTRMLIVSHDGERYYGIATAEDCGGAIKRDRMDLYFPTYQECIEFGRRRCTIYFLG